MPTIILDNGGATIKAGMSNFDTLNPMIINNAVVRSKGDRETYVGHEFERCRDFASLHYRLPFEKGLITDWDAQKAIWDGLFSSQLFNLDTKNTSAFITEPPFNLPNLQDVYDQFAFEEYEFRSYFRCIPAFTIPYGDLFSAPNLPTPDCVVIVDSGFSFTHVIPIQQGRVVWEAVVRIDVGGKLLTNHLKELVSFRQWNLMDESYVMNKVKEQSCFVTTNFSSDLEACRTDPKRNRVVQEYVLPNFASRRDGHVRVPGEALLATDQVLYMNNERFLVPEILFRPDDIGLDQLGLPGAIAHSINLLPEDTRGMYWANIGLLGGNIKFPGFQERLFTELRALAPVDCDVCLYLATEPITAAYRAAFSFVQTPDFEQMAVTREEYLEEGSNACRRKFHGWNKANEARQKNKESTKARGRNRDQLDDASSAITAMKRVSRKRQ